MGFEEDCRDADGHSRARQDRDELAFAAARIATATRLLHRVRRVEHDRRAEALHDRDRAHVGDERVVAEAGAALAGHDVRVTGAGDLGDHVLHVPRRQKLTLLDVDRLAGFGGGDQQIGLAAEEGRNLQDVHDFGDFGALLGQVHVGDDRHADLFADFFEDGRCCIKARAAFGREAGAVGFVEAGFVDEASAGALEHVA